VALFFAGKAAVLRLGVQLRILRVWQASLLGHDGAPKVGVQPDGVQAPHKLAQHLQLACLAQLLKRRNANDLAKHGLLNSQIGVEAALAQRSRKATPHH
jgi:hypothetical protein